MSFDGALHATLMGCAGVVLKGRPQMWKRTTVTISVKINLAACLLGVAAILKILI